MAKHLPRLLTFILLCSGIALALYYKDEISTDTLQYWLDNSGNAAPVIFILIYIIATVLFFPGSILTLLGGAIFGPVWGTLYNLIAGTLGAMIAFLLARYLASDWVSRKAGGKIKQLITGVEQEGWRFVAFTRLIPFFPFNLLNYALGLTKISFLQYSIASYIFMLPGSLAYTYLGYMGKETLTGGDNLIQKMLLAIALFACLAYIPRLVKYLRKDKSSDTEKFAR